MSGSDGELRPLSYNTNWARGYADRAGGRAMCGACRRGGAPHILVQGGWQVVSAQRRLQVQARLRARYGETDMQR